MSTPSWNPTSFELPAGRSLRRLAFVAAVVTLVGLFAPTPVSEAAVEGYQRAMTTLRLLSYDRNADKRSEGSPTFLIVSPPNGSPDGDKMREALEETSSNFEIAGGRPTIETLTYRGSEQFESDLADIDPIAAYITEELGRDIESITERTRQHSVLTFVADRPMVENGGSVAVVAEGRSYEIVVNLPAVRAEGADFPARVLNIADEVLRS